MNISPDKLSFIQKSLDEGAYDVVVKECSSLFENALKRMFHEAMVSLPYKDRRDLLDCEKTIGKDNKGVPDFTFGELVGFYRESNLLLRWAKHSSKDLGLIKSFNLAPIVDLRNNLIHSSAMCSRLEAELVFNYLRNLLATMGYEDLKQPVQHSMPNIKQPTTDTSLNANLDGRTKRFKLYPDRGVIINPSDNTRNISFKVDTFNSILEVINNEVSAVAGSDVAETVMYKAGYVSGQRFGILMNDKWELESDCIDFNEKINKWCEFDSDVGWGRFSNHLEIDELEENIEGHLCILENFAIYNRKGDNVSSCSFITGYMKGVLEQLLDGLPIDIICDQSLCPLRSAFKKKNCHLLVKRKGS